MDPEDPSLRGDRRNRTLRIVLSATLTFPIALIGASAIFPSFDGHAMHRAAAPLFMLVMLSPLWLGLIAFVSFALVKLDRRFANNGGISGRQNVIVIGCALFCTTAGFGHFLLGALPLWLLLYWLLTGRMLGHDGVSIETVHRDRWNERIYFVAFVSFFAAMAFIAASGFTQNLYYAIAPPTYGSPAFQPRSPHEMDMRLKRSLGRFPDTQACLVAGADAAGRKGLMKMDWSRMRTEQDVIVCTYRLLKDLGPLSEASAWMRANGFRSDGHSSETPYEKRNGTLRVSGWWSIREDGPRYPTKGVVLRALNALPYSMSLHATYSADGTRLLYVETSFPLL